MNETTYPRLLLEKDFDDQAAFEVEQKGWYGQALVALSDSIRVKVFFYDPVRLSQDLEYGLRSGAVCIAEPGMIVIPSVTRQYMEAAINQLYKQGFFESLVPIE